MASQSHPIRRLLVVDAEQPHCRLVARTAAGLGYSTDMAGTLEHAATQPGRHAYDAVVLDLSLAEAGALGVLQRLRGIAAQAAFILISGLDGRMRSASLWLASALGLRVAGALAKPIVPAALRTVLRNAQVDAARAGQPRVTADDLDAALRRQDIEAAFQPKIALADGRVVGVEALARWPRAAGAVPPDLFVPLAERNGLIVRLTFHILRLALVACCRWRTAFPACSVSVNVSPLVLADPDLPDAVERLLRENGLPPEALIAEITESTVIGQPLVAAAVLKRLRRKGIGLSIDDFGTGQSSLMTLHRLPYAELKRTGPAMTHAAAQPTLPRMECMEEGGAC